MSKVHVIKDENLGGVLREFVEVDRKAKIGEKIFIVRPDEGSVYEKGDVFTVEKSYENHPEYEDGVVVVDDFFFIYHSEYQTIEPTDIVHIDDPSGQPKRYRMVERKAEVGDKVIVIYDDSLTVNKGTVLTVTNVTGYDIDTDRKFTIDTRYDEYLVLVPLESADNDSIAVDESEASPSVVEMLGNLARRIVSLERQVESNATAIVDIQQDIGEIRDKVERLTHTCEQSDTSIARDVERIDTEVEQLKRGGSKVAIDGVVLAKLITEVVGE